MVHSLFWPFSNQEIILSMNFDGGRVKIDVRGTLQESFIGSIGPMFLREMIYV